jgi:adenylylsulfate kinase
MAVNNINNPWHNYVVDKAVRAKQKNQIPCLIWFTGLSDSGKSTISGKLEETLTLRGDHTYLLDGDSLWHGLNKDRDFLDIDRVENIRRVGEVSKLFVDVVIIVLSAFISPFKSDRNIVKELLGPNKFVNKNIELGN